MTTDRELLEAAAKAVNISGVWSNTRPGIRTRQSTADDLVWNPLTDDGDALRLAVKLGIGIARPEKTFPDVRRVFFSDLSGFSATDKNHCAATRRAIVRAAAEMGKCK